RELLLMFDHSGEQAHAFMGFVMDRGVEPYMRRDFAGAREAVAAFRGTADALREAGFIETADTNYSLRALPLDPKPKPAWQHGLAELLLPTIIDDVATQTALIEKLAATPAAREPFYLWLAARHNFAIAPKRHLRALAQGENARDAFGARRASRSPPYIWSLWPLDV